MIQKKCFSGGFILLPASLFGCDAGKRGRRSGRGRGDRAKLLTSGQKESTLGQSMGSLEVSRENLVETGRRLYERGFLAGSDGNLSIRLPDDRVLVTPSGQPKGRLSPADLVVIDLDGNHLEGARRASSEAAMHLFVYRERPEVRACVHSHAPCATAFAAAGEELPDNVLPEVVLFVGRIPLTSYAPPGTPAVPESLAPHIADHSAFLLRNHGLLTIGRSLEEAYNRHETVEHYARIVLLARGIGPVTPIPHEDVSRLETMRRKLEETPPGEG